MRIRAEDYMSTVQCCAARDILIAIAKQRFISPYLRNRSNPVEATICFVPGLERAKSQNSHMKSTVRVSLPQWNGVP